MSTTEIEVRIAFSADPPTACGACGGTVFHDLPQGGSYCDSCGVRRPAGRDHAEADLGPAAAASDIGTRHHHNEDGFALAAVGSTYVAVVCDGVSTSARADTASHAAAEAAIRAYARAFRAHATDGGVTESATADGPTVEGDTVAEAVVAAAEAAQAAAVAAAGTGDGIDSTADNPPSSTFVSAVVTPHAVTVGWVGDSRAYWIGDDGVAACLTVDDTFAGRMAAEGEEVSNLPEAHALLRWLGADSIDTAPHLVRLHPGGPGTVIVCSDGLYRYAASPEEMSAAVRERPTETPIRMVRSLVQLALDAGGADNVTVIALPYPPPGGSSQ